MGHVGDCRTTALSQIGEMTASEGSKDTDPCASPAVRTYAKRPESQAAMLMRTVCGASLPQTADLSAGKPLQGNHSRVGNSIAECPCAS